MNPRLRTLVIAVVMAISSASLPGAEAGTNSSSAWNCPNWGMYGRTVTRTFETDCPSPITRASVGRMLPNWFFKTDRTVTASPAVVGGIVYVGDWSGTMYAIGASTGTEIWRYKTRAAPGATFGPIVSSAAVSQVGDKRLVIFGSGPRVYALSAGTGKLVWVRYFGALRANGKPVLAKDPVEIESSPVVSRGIVYVGMDTHNLPAKNTAGIRGGLLALDAATGRKLWKFDPDKGHGCGGVWSSPTINPKLNLVYFGTANCERSRVAWTKYTEAVVALDASTGRPRWSFRPHKPNRNDWDFGATANLFVDPSGRDVLGVGNKDGNYYALNPASGKLRWKRKIVEPGDVTDDLSVGGIIGSASVYQGRAYTATAIGGPPYFHAIDAETGSTVWRDARAPSYAASASVNGVVFHGALDNVLRALDTDTGRLLWAAPLAGPISSGPAIVWDSVYVGSGTSSSDSCDTDSGDLNEVCRTLFEEGLGRTGGVHAFRLADDLRPSTAGVKGKLYSAQGNQLDVYGIGQNPPTWKPFVPQDSRGGRDLNGQVCSIGGRYLVMGEDSGQAKGVPQGWGILDINTGRQVGKLISRYPGVRTPEPYGCVIDVDSRGDVRRIFVTQVGSGDFESSNGQLIVFFPTSQAFDAVRHKRSADEVCPGGDCSRLTRRQSHYCVLDPHIRTAGGIAMDSRGNLLVTESAPVTPPNTPAPGRVLRYRAKDLPFSRGRCTTISPSTFMRDPTVATPGAIEPVRNSRGKKTGNWYVSSFLFPPVVNEYDPQGDFVRNILPPGFATPFGLAVDAKGSLYISDLGLTFDPTRVPDDPSRFGIDTGAGEGSVLRVRFSDGQPQPPEYLKVGLDFPDGLGIVE